MTYDDFKKKITENKIPIITAVGFVLMFIVGFGSGRYIPAKNYKPQTNYSNYTTKTTPTKAPAKPTATPSAFDGTPDNSTSTGVTSCLIKGNISTGGKKIYHMPGGALYKIVKPEQCFRTEAEAQAAGFVKSKR